MSAAFKTALQIDASHPALPGHFPGHPVVPGVVLLERVAAALEAWRGVGIGAVDAKFLHPLLPGEHAEIALQDDASRLRFSIVRADGTALARGTLEALP